RDAEAFARRRRHPADFAATGGVQEVRGRRNRALGRTGREGGDSAQPVGVALAHWIVFNPVDLITSAHLTVWLRTSFPNSPGDIGIASAPSSWMRVCSLGFFNTALTPSLSLATISGGVPFGTAM